MLKGHGGPIMGIAAAPDGWIATASFDNTIGIWQDETPTWLDGHEAAINAAIFTEAGIFSAGDDYSVRLWTGARGTLLGTHTAKVMGLVALPGAVAAASWDAIIEIWPLDGGSPMVAPA